MPSDEPENSVTSVPNQAFDQFLKVLGEKGISPSVVAGLKEILIDNENLSEDAIKAALFQDNPDA